MRTKIEFTHYVVGKGGSGITYFERDELLLSMNIIHGMSFILIGRINHEN